MTKLNILVAYPYCTATILETLARYKDGVRFLLDCGAFTAWKIGKPITLDQYCAFVEGLPLAPWRYFALDVIGNAKATMANYEEMLRRGHKAVPIFTRGEHHSVLEDFFKTSDVVGIGGVASQHQDPNAYLKHLWDLLPSKRVHILGWANTTWIRHFRPYSCDASSWEAGGRYGTMPVYLGAGRFEILHRVDMVKKPAKKLIDRIAAMGFNPYLLQREEHWRGDNGVSRWVGAMSYVHFMRDVEQNIGVKYFLALSANRADMLVDCHYRMTSGQWSKDAKVPL